jgi:type II secretory pathway component PulK
MPDRRTHGTRRPDGHALISMLVVLVFLTAVIGAMTSGLMSEMKYVQLQQQYVTVRYVARSGFETACRELLNDPTRYDAPTDPWGPNAAVFENIAVGEGVAEVSHRDEATGDLRYGVVDEERKLNVNLAAPEVLQRLSPAFTDEIVDTVVKARSERPFVTLDQMAALPNMPQGFLDETSTEAPAGLRSLLTVRGDGRVNVNTAPAAVLAALPGFDAEMAGKVVSTRTAGGGALESLGDVQEALGEAAGSGPLREQLKVSSEYFTIRAEGRLLNTNVATVIEWVVHREGDELSVLDEVRVQ